METHSTGPMPTSDHTPSGLHPTVASADAASRSAPAEADGIGEVNEATMENCRLCPRQCGVNRNAGQKGVCGVGSELYIARAALHFWEEPCISGKEGSGAVFFSGCTLRCCYCQNGSISAGGFGKAVTTARLREIFEALIAQGAHNINLVTPTHFLPWILPALEPKLPVPVVYNCGGYESVETLRRL